jgi:transposase-like protein
MYLDCIFIKVRDNHTVINKAVYLALGVNMVGKKELLGMWISKTEGAKFWMQVVTELKNRGVKDILIACTDGLKGFPEAINSIFPETKIQLCIIDIVKNSLKFVLYKDKKEIWKDLKLIYQANTEEIGLEMLMKLKEKWDGKYPTIGSLWERNWDGISTIYCLPGHIRKAVYTTNIIESINRQIRKIIKNKAVFPHDEAAKKILFLTLQNASKKWTPPIREWSLALNQLSIFIGKSSQSRFFIYTNYLIDSLLLKN